MTSEMRTHLNNTAEYIASSKSPTTDSLQPSASGPYTVLLQLATAVAKVDTADMYNYGCAHDARIEDCT